MAVRPFCNADLPQLVNLWNEHWSTLGPDPMVGMAQFEQAIVARTFFRPERLLVAESESETIDGWCLFFGPSHDNEAAPETDSGFIGCLCLASAADPAVGDWLLQSAEERLVQAGAQSVHVGPVRDDRYGLAGLSPIGHGVGVPDHDFRFVSILNQRGYRPTDSYLRMTATVNGYRPPVSRDAMQLRRTTQVDMVAFLHDDERAAAAMSHLDVEMHRLIDRTDSVLARVKLWFSDPEAEVMNPAISIINLSTIGAAGGLSPAESYLIGTAVQSLVPRGIAVVEGVVDGDNQNWIDQMQTLNFSPADSGNVWTKPL